MGELYNTFGMLKPEVFRDEGFVGNSRIGASQASSKRGTWKISQELSQLKTCWTEKTLIFHKVKYEIADPNIKTANIRFPISFGANRASKIITESLSHKE
jgi:hypothetical protein